jgi:hypothetical protein
MKTLQLVIIGIAIIGGIVPALILFGTITNNSPQTLTLRFSQSFFNIFTLISASVIVLGSVILFMAINERKIRNKQVTLQIILIGSVIIFLGFGVFSFALID